MRLRNNAARLALGVGAALLLQAQASPPPDDLPQGTGPRGTSQVAPGQERYDAVGYANVEPSAGDGGRVAITSHKVSPGSFVEVTALDTGKTIAAIVTGDGRGVTDREAGLSPAAAAALGINASQIAPVRVRAIEPSPPDQGALRAGRAAGARLDAPKMLLVALRKRLPLLPIVPVPVVPVGIPAPLAVRRQPDVPVPSSPVAAASATIRKAGASYPAPGVDRPPRPAPSKPAPSKPAPLVPTPPADRLASRSTALSAALPNSATAGPHGLYVQIAALANAARASALAKTVGGSVVAGAGLYRVRVGPYRDQRAAGSARDAMVRQGYGDARIVTNH